MNESEIIKSHYISIGKKAASKFKSKFKTKEERSAQMKWVRGFGAKNSYPHPSQNDPLQSTIKSSIVKESKVVKKHIKDIGLDV